MNSLDELVLQCVLPYIRVGVQGNESRCVSGIYGIAEERKEQKINDGRMYECGNL